LSIIGAQRRTIDRMSICLACGRDHPPVHHEAELCLPWAAVGHAVIDNEADLVATFVNEHNKWLVVQATNSRALT